ncbi:MAG: hypothetical protein PHV82_03015 [Victivallaceae bacterium]|nr:hypothetical protein [Victivallaceae bacterium]
MIFDVNISWGVWPFQPLRFASVAKLKKSLLKNGIYGGLVRSAEAAFSPDLEHCNRKLSINFKTDDNFIPVPTISPRNQEWKHLLESEIRFFAVYPSYHDYSVLSIEFAELAKWLENKNKVLIVVVRQEDERGHNKLCQIPPVPVTEINKLGRQFINLKIICLNCYFGELKTLLTDVPNVNADIAFAETMNTIRTIEEQFGHQQIVFGSHTPFLYSKAALMKLKNSGVSEGIFNAIASENIKRILK